MSLDKIQVKMIPSLFVVCNKSNRYSAFTAGVWSRNKSRHVSGVVHNLCNTVLIKH